LPSTQETAPGSSSDPRSSPIRVMVVDDSAVIRRTITKWLGESPQFVVVAAHHDGRAAADDVVRSQPEVVILDIEMPGMDGLTALPLILQRKPGTIVLVASTLSRRGAEVSLKALTLGAADYLPKPDASAGGAGAEEFRQALFGKVRQLALKARGASGSSLPGGTTAPSPRAGPQKVVSMDKLRPYSSAPVRALVIGSSTGGPQALTQLFSEIGPSIANVPVFVTQHMPSTFTPILADHIRTAARMPAREGRDGERAEAGTIYVAPGGRHMLVAREGSQTVIRLSDGPPINFCRPAVDPLFETAAGVFQSGTFAIVLTGMGSDGAHGARIVADAGGSVIAQDEASSVVWGMPGATFATGACSDVLPINEIGGRVIRFLTRGRS